MQSVRLRFNRTTMQQGIALLTGLVLMTAISLLALMAAASMAQQHRMAGNFADAQLARQASALAVMRGRDFLFAIGDEMRTPACLQYCFLPPFNAIIHQESDLPANPEFEDEAWWRSQGVEAGADPKHVNRVRGTWEFAPEPPRFLIEEIHFDDMSARPRSADGPPLNGIGYYRILGRGSGAGPAAVAVTEAIIARPWRNDSPAGPAAAEGSRFCAAFEPWYDCGLMVWRGRR